MNILVGADPELFMKRKGKFVSAHGMVEGNKENPFPVLHGAVQVDGMALEFNIDPAKNEKEFLRNLHAVMAQLKDMVPDHEVLAVPTAKFTPAYMKKQPPEALELGCEPDYNAYTGLENDRPNGNVDFRTGAGHIHIGWTEGVDPHQPTHFEACRILTQQLDVMLGVPSLLWDRDNKRRKLYGQAGAFRPKPYGCEYRVLSNAWLKDDTLMKFVYKTVQQAFKHLVDHDRYYQLRNEQCCPRTARDVIDHGRTDHSKHYCVYTEEMKAYV